ncbi:MAG: hypothetical protein E6I32_07650, partial [Chloroflexi bacterium]
MHPHHALRRRSHGLHGPFPHLRLALALHTLAVALSLGGRLPDEWLLLGNAQQFPRGRLDRQHRLQQKALVPAVADGTQPTGLAMGLIIQLRRILH